MIEPLIDGLFFFVGLGFMKAVVEPVAKTVFQRKVLKYAPVIIKILDERLPQFIGSKNGEEIEDFVREVAEAVSGESWKHKEIDSLFQRYDVRIAASKALSDEQKDSSQ